MAGGPWAWRPWALLLAALGGLQALAGGAEPWWQAVDIDAQLWYFRYVYSHAEWFATEGLGEFCLEAESVFHVMRRSLARNSRVVFVDVGSNTGNTIAAMCGAFADPRRGPLTIWGFEPNPETHASLQRGLRLKGGLGSFHHIRLMQAAVSDRSGSSSFFHRGNGDVLAGLVVHPDREAMNNGRSKDTEVTVDVVTLDETFGRNVRVHLLKIDAEGYDPLVLRGARRLLRMRQVKFIVFEYDVAWISAGHNLTLQAAVQEVYSIGYSCFLMTKAALLPLYDFWWQSVYDSISWGNVFCGQSDDHDLFDAYLAQGVSSNYTLAFALGSLRSSSTKALRWVH